MSQKEEEAGLRKHEYFTTVIYYCQLMLASQQWCKAFQVLFYQIYWEIWYQFSSRKQQWKLRYRLDVQLFHLKILWGFSSYTNVFLYIYILKDTMLSLSITEHSRTFEILYEFGTTPGKLYSSTNKWGQEAIFNLHKVTQQVRVLWLLKTKRFHVEAGTAFKTK